MGLMLPPEVVRAVPKLITYVHLMSFAEPGVGVGLQTALCSMGRRADGDQL